MRGTVRVRHCLSISKVCGVRRGINEAISLMSDTLEEVEREIEADTEELVARLGRLSLMPAPTLSKGNLRASALVDKGIHA